MSPPLTPRCFRFRLESSSRYITDQSTLSFLDPSSLSFSSACRAQSPHSPLPVARSCADTVPSPPVPPSPPGLSAVCLPVGRSASPPIGCAAAEAASLLVPAADLSLPRSAQPVHPDIPPPAALSPVSVGPAAAAPTADTADEMSALLASRYLRAPQGPLAVPESTRSGGGGGGGGGGGSVGGGEGMLMGSLGLSVTLQLDGDAAEITDEDDRLSLSATAADVSAGVGEGGAVCVWGGGALERMLCCVCGGGGRAQCCEVCYSCTVSEMLLKLTMLMEMMLTMLTMVPAAGGL